MVVEGAGGGRGAVAPAGREALRVRMMRRVSMSTPTSVDELDDGGLNRR
jgi:hypothetical protein